MPTYHLDPLTGNDSNSGSQLYPMRTMRAIESRIQDAELFDPNDPLIIFVYSDMIPGDGAVFRARPNGLVPNSTSELGTNSFITIMGVPKFSPGITAPFSITDVANVTLPCLGSTERPSVVLSGFGPTDNHILRRKPDNAYFWPLKKYPDNTIDISVPKRGFSSFTTLVLGDSVEWLILPKIHNVGFIASGSHVLIANVIDDTASFAARPDFIVRCNVAIQNFQYLPGIFINCCFYNSMSFGAQASGQAFGGQIIGGAFRKSGDYTVRSRTNWSLSNETGGPIVSLGRLIVDNDARVSRACIQFYDRLNATVLVRDNALFIFLGLGGANNAGKLIDCAFSGALSTYGTLPPTGITLDPLPYRVRGADSEFPHFDDLHLAGILEA